MNNICKTVTLRTRKIKKGSLFSLYLDYYPGYRNETTLKVVRHESLGIYIFVNPKNRRERKYNNFMMEKAEAIRCRRFECIINERYDFFDKEKMKGSFLDYFKSYATNKSHRDLQAFRHFAFFASNKCSFLEVNIQPTEEIEPCYHRKSVAFYCFYHRKSVVFIWKYHRKSVSLRRKYINISIL